MQTIYFVTGCMAVVYPHYRGIAETSSFNEFYVEKFSIVIFYLTDTQKHLAVVVL